MEAGVAVARAGFSLPIACSSVVMKQIPGHMGSMAENGAFVGSRADFLLSLLLSPPCPEGAFAPGAVNGPQSPQAMPGIFGQPAHPTPSGPHNTRSEGTLFGRSSEHSSHTHTTGPCASSCDPACCGLWKGHVPPQPGLQTLPHSSAVRSACLLLDLPAKLQDQTASVPK